MAKIIYLRQRELMAIEDHSNLLFIISKYFTPTYDKEALSYYLRRLFLPLSIIHLETQEEIIPFVIFHKLIQLPLIISKHLYRAFTKRDIGLTIDDFVKGFVMLYKGTIEEKLGLLFSLYDLNQNGEIIEKDVELLLKYFHYHKLSIKHVEIKEESYALLRKIISEFFNGKSVLTYFRLKEELLLNSDMIILLLIFFEHFNPFQAENINLLQDKSIKTENNLQCKKEYALFGECNEDLFLYINLRFDEELIFNHTNQRNSIDELDQFEQDLHEVMANENNTKNDNTRLTNRGDESQMISTRINSIQSTIIPKFSLTPLEISKTSSHLVSQAYTILNSPTSPNKKSQSAIILQGVIIIENETHHISLSLLNQDLIISHKGEIIQLIDMKNYYISIDENTTDENDNNLYSLLLSPYYSLYLNEIRVLCDDYSTLISFVDNATKSLNQRNIKGHYTFYADIWNGNTRIFTGSNIHKPNETVAIKIITKKNQSPSIIEMIETEVELAHLFIQCSHPYIVKPIEIFETANHYCIVYEYLPKGTLTDFIKKKTIVITEKINEYIIQIVHAVQFLHNFGIIHRDIKTDNILVSIIEEKIIMKLNDFGICKIIGFSEKAYEGCGSLVYTAPEILFNLPYDHKVDIWGLGILAYYMVYQLYPFSSKNNDDKITTKRIMKGHFAFPSKDKNLLSNADIQIVNQFISQCLEHNQEKRLTISQLLKLKIVG